MTASVQDVCFIGTSGTSRQLSHDVELAARSDAKVLITGETGVGKDIVARLIHTTARADRSPLSTINCAGLPDTLLESELFGHVRGSFTGAFRDKAGLLEVADRGTAFLDEAGEMSTAHAGHAAAVPRDGRSAACRLGARGPARERPRSSPPRTATCCSRSAPGRSGRISTTG